MTNTFSTKPINTWLDTQITVGRIGHSTVLINFFGTWIMTDPVFSAWFGIPILRTPWSFGVKRIHKPQLRIHDLPAIDIILLSHSHMDHLHPYSCKKIVKHSHDKTQIIVAPGVKKWLSSSLYGQMHELDRGQEISLAGVTFRACEVNHRGARYPWTRDRSRGHHRGASYNAYMFEKNNKIIFFAGDTAYTDILKSYAPKVCDLAIMPIGSYDPWIKQHCNPEQALQMAQMLHAKNAIGIHRDTRGRPAKKREGDKPLRRFLESAPKYTINILWNYEGEIITL